jgi:hypothetical protein
MGHQHDTFRAAIDGMPNCRQCSNNALVVGDSLL